MSRAARERAQRVFIGVVLCQAQASAHHTVPDVFCCAFSLLFPSCPPMYLGSGCSGRSCVFTIPVQEG